MHIYIISLILILKEVTEIIKIYEKMILGFIGKFNIKI